MTVNDLKEVVDRLLEEGLGDVDCCTGFYDEETDEIVTDDISVLAIDGEDGDQVILFANGEVYDAVTENMSEKDNLN